MFNGYDKSQGGPVSDWPKWQRVLTSEAEDQASCTESEYVDWQSFIDGLADGTSAKRQLEKINSEGNRRRYQRDGDAFEKRDVWQSPREFLTRGAGDCEDFAILKYFASERLGFDPILVLVGSDFGLHAVTAVDIAGESWVLDNRMAIAAKASMVARIYQPKIALDQDGWWRYRRPAASEIPVA